MTTPRSTLSDRIKNSRRHRTYVQGKAAEAEASSPPPVTTATQPEEKPIAVEQPQPKPAPAPAAAAIASKPSEAEVKPIAPMEKPVSAPAPPKPISVMSARSRALELGRRRRQANRAAAEPTSNNGPNQQNQPSQTEPKVATPSKTVPSSLAALTRSSDNPAPAVAPAEHKANLPIRQEAKSPSPTKNNLQASRAEEAMSNDNKEKEEVVPWPDQEEQTMSTNHYQMTSSPPKIMAQSFSHSPSSSEKHQPEINYHRSVQEQRRSFEASVSSSSPSPPKRQPYRKSPPPPPPAATVEDRVVVAQEDTEDAAPSKEQPPPSNWTGTSTSSPMPSNNHHRSSYQPQPSKYANIRSPFLPKEDPPAPANRNYSHNHNSRPSYKTPEKRKPVFREAEKQQQQQQHQQRTPSPEATRDAYGAVIETPKVHSVASLRQSFNARAKEPIMPMNSPDLRIRSSFSDVQSDVGSATSSHVRYSYAVRQNWQGRPIAESSPSVDPSSLLSATPQNSKSQDPASTAQNIKYEDDHMKSPSSSIPWHKDGVETEDDEAVPSEEPKESEPSTGLSQAAMARQLLQNQLKSEPKSHAPNHAVKSPAAKRVSGGKSSRNRWQSSEDNPQSPLRQDVEATKEDSSSSVPTSQHRTASPVVIPDVAHQYNPRPQSYRRDTQPVRSYVPRKPEPAPAPYRNDEDDVPARPVVLHSTERNSDLDMSKPVILSSKREEVPGPFILPSRERPVAKEAPLGPTILPSSRPDTDGRGNSQDDATHHTPEPEVHDHQKSHGESSPGSGTLLVSNVSHEMEPTPVGNTGSNPNIHEKLSPAEELLLTDSEDMDDQKGEDYGLTENQLMNEKNAPENLQVETEVGSRSGGDQITPTTSTSPGKLPKLSPSPRDSDAYKAAYFSEDSFSPEKGPQQDPPTAAMEYQQDITRRMYDVKFTASSRREHAESYVSDTEDDDSNYSPSGYRNYPVIQTENGESLRDQDYLTPGSFPQHQAASLPHPYQKQQLSDPEDDGDDANVNPPPAQDIHRQVAQPAKTTGGQVLKYIGAGNAWVEGTTSREEEEEADMFDEMDEWKDKDPDFFPELDEEDDDFHNDNLSPSSRGAMQINTGPYYQNRHTPVVPSQSPGAATHGYSSNPATPSSSSWRATNDVFQSPAQTPEGNNIGSSDRKSSSRRKKSREAFDPFGLEEQDQAANDISDEIFAPGMETFPTMESFSPPKFEQHGGGTSTPRSRVSFARSPQTYASNSPGWDDDADEI